MEPLEARNAEALVEDGVLSVQAAMDFLSLSRAGLYREIAAGRLHFVKIGRRTAIPRRAAIRLLAEGLRGGVAATRADR